MRLSSTQKFGLKWEEWALDQLHQKGYHDARLVSDYFADVDIMLGSLPIEVKAAHGKPHRVKKKYWRTRWEFDTSRLPNWADSLVILVALADEPYPFFVPSWMVACRYNVHITSHPEAYKGFFKQFLNNWEWVAKTLTIRARYAPQMPLPLMGNGDSAQLGSEWGQNIGQCWIEKTLSPFPTGAQL